MTVVVGKTHINLGWEALIGLIIFAISTTWAICSYKNSQDNKLDKILSWQQVHTKKDSIQDVRLDSAFAWHEKATSERNALKVDVDYILNAIRVKHTSDGFFTERYVNGKLLFEKVKTN